MDGTSPLSTPDPPTQRAAQPPARVVVVGAGFAGLAAARALTARRGPGSPEGIEATIVDRNNFHTFLPLLYQVATAGLEPGDVAYPVRTVFRRRQGVQFRHADVVGIDVDGRRVHLDDGAALSYDHLIVASGAAANYFDVDGAAEHALPLYMLSDARRLRNQLLATLESADAHPDRFDGAAPGFVVVGAGPTGVETAGALVELLQVAVRRDRLRLDAERTRVVLVDMVDRVLPGSRPDASRYAEQSLRRRGVDVRLGDGVAAVEHHCVRLRSGVRIPASLVVWAGGVTVAGTPADGLPGERGRNGRVAVGEDLSLPRHPEVHVVGDAAAVPDGRGGLCPQLAQVAIQSGRHAGRQVRRLGAGLTPEPFTYLDKGTMATIGRRAAVAEVPHLPTIRGTVGWLAWLGLHLVYLIGFRNRLMVLLNWLWRYIDWPSGPRVIVADPHARPAPRPTSTPGDVGSARPDGEPPPPGGQVVS